MMLIVIDDELEQLRELRPLDRDVFNYLAERTDFETAIIGVARRVSYFGMCCDLSEQAVARRSKESLTVVTVTQLQNAVKRLVAVGMLERLSESTKGSCLKLRRVLLANAMGLPNSVQNPVARQLLFKQLTKLQTIVNKNNELSDKNNSSCQPKAVSVATTSLLSINQPDDRFLMTSDWKPTQHDYDALLHMSGVDKAKIDPVWISEFVSFWWSSDSKRKLNQREWTRKLCMHLIFFAKNPGSFDKKMGYSLSSPRPATMGTNQTWASIPRDENQLQSWARANGFPDAQIGQSFDSYRQTLRNCVERKQKQEFKRLQ